MMDAFEVSMGKFVGGKFSKGRQVGTAFYNQTSNKHYYRIELWQYKGESFYLTRNKDNGRYTLFAEIDDPGRRHMPIFQKPIGYAYASGDLPGFLQIQLNFPWEKCFINLKPIN